MSNRLVIVFGANGGVGSMLMPCLVGHQDLKVVTCGRKQWASDAPHYDWSFGEEPPISRIIEDHADSEAVIALYSAIVWPQCAEDVEKNISAFTSVASALPEGASLISLSSLVVETQSATHYANLKRREESVCHAYGGTSLRLGMIDSNQPFGQTRMFARLAGLFHMVPVPFPRASVILSKEADIASAVLGMIEGKQENTSQVVEVRSSEMSFIEAIKHILHRHKLKFICIPIPDLITNGLLVACEKLAPNSWLSERLHGLQAFSRS